MAGNNSKGMFVCNYETKYCKDNWNNFRCTYLIINVQSFYFSVCSTNGGMW